MESRFSSRLRLRLKSLALDKYLERDRRNEAEPEETLGPSSFEYAIIKLFIIDLARLAELKATLAKNFHIQPSELDRMPFWEYELFLRSLNKQVDEENKRQEDEMKKYHLQEHMDAVRPGNMRKMMDTSKFSPSMPNFGSMKTPSFKF